MKSLIQLLFLNLKIPIFIFDALKVAECILIGDLKNKFEKIFEIKVTNKTIQCLGIYIGHDKEECYNQNWMRIYHDIEKLFES